MDPLYTLSLVPVLAVAIMLFFSTVLYTRRAHGLALYSLAVAAWAGALFVSSFPELAEIGRRGAAIGTLVGAAYIHAAYELTRQPRFALV